VVVFCEKQFFAMLYICETETMLHARFMFSLCGDDDHQWQKMLNNLFEGINLLCSMIKTNIGMKDRDSAHFVLRLMKIKQSKIMLWSTDGYDYCQPRAVMSRQYDGCRMRASRSPGPANGGLYSSDATFLERLWLNINIRFVRFY